MKQINQLLDMVDGSKRSEAETLLSCILDEHEALQQQVRRELQEARQAAVNMMEDAMCANEKLELTQFALDHAADPVFWINKQSSFTYVNEAACRKLAYSPEELTSMKVADIDPDFPAEQWPEHWRKIKEAGSMRFESHHQTKQGKLFPVEIYGSFILQGEKEYIFAFAHDITVRKQSEASFKQIEWMLSGEPPPGDAGKNKEFDQGYGDLTALNHDGLILNSIGREQLEAFARDYLDLLGTSSAIYEANGHYALGIFSSGWCRMLDCASRRLCDTPDNIEALNSGRWLCHESCWTDCCKQAIAKGKPVDIECNGGLRMYAVPIKSRNDIVGAINFGYGDPPGDPKKLRQLAGIYHVDCEELVRKARAYDSRPSFIIELAKKRLHATARLIGSMIETKQIEEALRESREHFSTLLSNLPGMAYRCKNDDGWTMLFVSDGCEAVTGHTTAELTGEQAIPYEQLIHPDDGLFVRQQVDASLRADDRFELEYRIIAKDGTEKWVWDRGEGRCGDGESLRLEGFISDITARKSAELRFQEQLKELNRWYEAMLGRESRVLELKREVNALLEQSGQALRYEVSEEKSEAAS